MRIEVVPWPVLQDRRREGQFDAFVARVIDGPHPGRFRRRWVTGGAANFGGYSESRQPAMFRQIHKIIYDDQPYTFLWRRPSLWALNNRLRGVEVSPLGITGFHPGPRAWWFPAGR